jgi:hypothetical protein
LYASIELESNASHTGGALNLRALNDTKSAFVAIEFASDFFEDFTLSSDMKSFSCKVVVKVIVSGDDDYDDTMTSTVFTSSDNLAKFVP